MSDRFGYGEIGLDIDPRHPCEGCRDYEAPDGCKSNGGCGKPQTNADRIRAMTDEELAELMEDKGDCPPIECPHDGEGAKVTRLDCKDCWLEWLKQEVDNG